MITETPTAKKGKEVKDSYKELDHVLVSNGSWCIAWLVFQCLLTNILSRSMLGFMASHALVQWGVVA